MKVEIPGQGRVIAHYGEDAQSMIHMEECAELIQAVSKMRRVRKAYLEGGMDDDSEAYYNLVEECADVLICLEQMQEMYGISDQEIQAMVDRKAARMEERMNELDRRLFEGQPVH
jgi:NTP pyrophosphatase (non-canonical NTP hydrolase)